MPHASSGVGSHEPYHARGRARTDEQAVPVLAEASVSLHLQKKGILKIVSLFIATPC